MTAAWEPPRVLNEITHSAIDAAFIMAQMKHNGRTPASAQMSDGERLAILMEEVGEVARELTYDSGGNKDKIVRELIQVAAMAAGWAEVAENQAPASQ